MPISFIKKDERLSVYLWEIAEDDDTLFKQAALTPDEHQRFLTFRAKSRRQQWLAVRCLVNKVFGRKVLIAYDEEGRPSIPDLGLYISISHSDTYAAVVVGKNRMLGVDVESITRNYAKIQSKFIAEDEKARFKERSFLERIYLPLAWSAKEAAFKAAFRCELDFIRDITILSVEADERFSVGEVVVALNPSDLKGTYKFYTFNNHMVVWGEYGDL